MIKPFVLNKQSDKTVLILVSKPDIKSEAIEEYIPGNLLKSFAQYIQANVIIYPVIHEYTEKENETLLNKYRKEVFKFIIETKPYAIVLAGKTAGLSLLMDFSPTKDLGKAEILELANTKIKVFYSTSPDYVLKTQKDSDLKNLFLVADLVNMYINSDQKLPFSIIDCEDDREFLQFIKLLKKEPIVAIDYETPSLIDLDIVSVGFAYGEKDNIKALAYRINSNNKPLITEVLFDTNNKIVAHNAKFEHKVNIVNFNKTRFLEDTMLMLNILDESAPANLEFVSQFSGLTIKWKKDYWSNEQWRTSPEFLQYNATDAAVTLHAYYFLLDQLKEQVSSYKLFAYYAIPVAYMELNGLYLNADYDLLDKFEKTLQYLKLKIGFDVSSRNELKRYFIDELKLDFPRTEKGNYSFTTKFLLSHPDERVRTIGQIKQLQSYIQFIRQYIGCRDSQGLVHTNYIQTGTRTGRLASQNPNLQNVPKNLLRKFFTSRYGKDGLLVEFDYNQLEPRILATLSKDRNLLKLFKENKDLHSYVASEIFHIDYDEFVANVKTNEDYAKKRYIGKQMNLGIMYGLSPYGLAERTNIPEHEAKDIIQNYFKRFPGVRKFISQCSKFLKEHGYVQDLFGRRRHLIANNKKAFRQAVNFPVTSTGNQCCQLAATYFIKTNKNKYIKLCANIHDALLLDIRKEDLNETIELVSKAMDFPNKFLVCKLTWEIKIGENWYESRAYNKES